MEIHWNCCFILFCVVLSIRGKRVLIFEDNFKKLDLAVWDHEVTASGGGNGEFQVYTPDPANSFTEDGVLHIKPILTRDSINPKTGKPFGEDYLWNGVMNLTELYGRCTNSDNNGCFREGKYGVLPSVMSARLQTYKRFSFKFGRMEVEAKMPVGDWLWPAVWLLPEDWTYGGWPRSGEIDLVESRGNRALLNGGGNVIGMQQMSSTLHWGPRWDANKYFLTHGEQQNTSRSFGDYFHNYAVEWNENGFRFFLDGNHFLDVPYPLIHENPDWKGFWDFGLKHGGYPPNVKNPWSGATNMAPFDKKFHLIVNVAVGGTNGYFPDDCINRGGTAPKPWQNGEKEPDVKFWKANNYWFPTWEGPNAALQIKSIKIYQDL